ncbi:MAG: VOC family protein [Candidatus Dojkabacteria bacterium]
MLLTNYNDFIDQIYDHVNNLGIDTSSLKIDHLGYQADSAEDYDNLVKDPAVNKVSEKIVGDRRVGIFKLNKPITYKDQNIGVIEIFEPRAGQTVKSTWEHVEFLTNTSPENLISTYPTIDWDKSALNREEFPMLILQLGEGLRAKFPRIGVLEELKRQESK